ncbi:hypothetical protein [Kineosporia sp. A_224]|uniref:Eco57I restriction-modification methylase domain-containing protein n=1 Tax=Kineosporia sp. A_224 TaxID=1962180 RepID=UPI000B4A938D|nr:hypothetical protein [Kineosporia sp. A_224]
MTDAAGLLTAAAAQVLAAEGPAMAQDAAAWRDTAIRHAAATAWRAGDAEAVRALASGYGALLCLEPVLDGGDVALTRVGIAERRRRGAFGTPAALAAVLAAHALPAAFPASGPDAAPTVVDPACGSGALLRAAFARLVEVGVPPAPAAAALHGVDDDPVAVDLARTVLAVDAVEAGAACAPADLAARVVLGDALLGATPLLPAAGPGGLAWHEAFPAVLADPAAAADPLTGWRGGFTAVVANPPWERLKVTRKDWQHRPPTALRADRAASARGLREAGRHPLTGAGEINAYLPFLETCWRLLAPHGRAGVVVPAGVAADRSASRLLGALLDAGALERLHLLDQAAPVFEDVSSRVGVAVVVLRSGACGPAGAGRGEAAQPGQPERPPAEVVVGLVDPARPAGEQAWALAADVPWLVNPNTGTPPLCTSARDAALVTAAHRRFPVLLRRGADGGVVDSPWQARLVTSMHMTRDARWFATAPGPGLVPLWEAKHAGLLDHRGGGRAAHRYWVPRDLVEERFGALAGRGWLAGYRNVTTTDSPRTLIPTALPVAGVGNSLPLLDAPRLPLLLAALASLPVDHLVRQKHAGANLNFFKLEQVALPPPEAYDVPAPWAPGRTLAAWALDRFAAAHAWDDSLGGLAAELAAAGVAVPSSARPADVVAADRVAALADLDAVHAWLLGWSRDDLAHVLTTFPALREREVAATGRFGTAERALAAYDALG